MRVRTCLWLLATCASLAACTSSPSGPVATVTTPAVGRPQPPASAQAALSREAFTPYAALGQSNADGLAPGQSYFALARACLTAAGYPDAANIPISIDAGPANLAFAQPWGAWGYLGTAQAQQYGFQAPFGAALSQLGIDVPTAPSGTVPAAEQSATSTCSTIASNFTNATQNSALAMIATLSNDIYQDIRQDPAVRQATHAWTSCMTRNGYSFGQPENVFFTELRQMHGDQRPITPGEPVSPAANHAQLAVAATDATCTQAADLAGIFFATETSYEQQLVTANQQALAAAVRQYRTAYATELRKLPALLHSASAKPARSPATHPNP